jgi:hypothetical protein
MATTPSSSYQAPAQSGRGAVEESLPMSHASVTIAGGAADPRRGYYSEISTGLWSAKVLPGSEAFLRESR